MNTNVIDFGAVSDGSSLCTSEIQAAIDACAASGGGVVTFPAGKYLCGTVWLKSNVELHLEHGSVLKASENLDDYNAEDAYEQNFSSRTNEKWLGKHLIIAHECENVALTGSGTIDGSGDAFLAEIAPYSSFVWREGCRSAKSDELCRPGQLVCFIECRNVRVENVTLTNQPCWGCFLHGCECVTVRGMKSFNHHANFNSDGIDIDCCRFVTVSDCIIDTGDDAIAIRGSDFRLKNKPHPCEFVTISNCVLGSSSSTIRIGVGTGLIHHVRISNVTITRGAPAFTLMSSYHGKGNVSIEDVSITNVSAVNCARVFDIVEGAGAPIKNITLESVYVETDGFINLDCSFPDTVSNVTMRNWRICMTAAPNPINPRDYERMGTVWFRAKNVCALNIDSFEVYDDGGYLASWKDGIFDFSDCKALKLSGVTVNGMPYVK